MTPEECVKAIRDLLRDWEPDDECGDDARMLERIKELAGQAEGKE